MSFLRPQVTQALAFAAVHQLVVLCVVASLWVSKTLSAFLAVFLWLLDLPAFLAAILLRDIAHLPPLEHWDVPLPADAPDAPLAALHFYGSSVAVALIVGAVQWFLIGFGRVEGQKQKPER